MSKSFTYDTYALGVVAKTKRKIKSGSEYDKLFPQAKGVSSIRHPDGDVYQTLDYMQDIIQRTLYQTKGISRVLKGANLYQTCKNIFDFCYNHIQYKLDDAGMEQLRQPSRTWKDRKTGVDCDCFSIFISSILTNLAIAHKLRIVELAGKGYFQHVYVVVDNGSSDVIIIDPVLDTFNTQAVGISKIYDKTMGIPIQELSGVSLGCNGDATCVACKNNLGCAPCGACKKSAAQHAASAADKLNAMELKMLRPIYDQLVNAKAQIKRNPSTVKALYKPEAMVQSIDYALKNWSVKAKREKALEVLASQDAKIMSDYMPRVVSSMQGLLGLSDDEAMGMLGLGYYTDGLGNVSLGGFWSGIKSAAGTVGKYTSSAAKAAYNSVKKGVKFVGTKAVVATKAVKQASVWTANKVADGAKFVAKNVMKYNPLSIVARNAYLLLVRMNFRGWANGLKSVISNPKGQAKLKSKWESTLISGEYSSLKSAIESGSKRHRLMGLGNNGLGEPITVATALASASGIIAALMPLISEFKSDKDNVDTSTSVTPAQASYTDSPAQNQVQQSSLVQEPTSSPSPSPITSKPSTSSTGLIIGAVGLAAIAFFMANKHKAPSLSGTEKKHTIHIQL